MLFGVPLETARDIIEERLLARVEVAAGPVVVAPRFVTLGLELANLPLRVQLFRQGRGNSRCAASGPQRFFGFIERAVQSGAPIVGPALQLFHLVVEPDTAALRHRIQHFGTSPLEGCLQRRGWQRLRAVRNKRPQIEKAAALLRVQQLAGIVDACEDQFVLRFERGDGQTPQRQPTTRAAQRVENRNSLPGVAEAESQFRIRQGLSFRALQQTLRQWMADAVRVSILDLSPKAIRARVNRLVVKRVVAKRKGVRCVVEVRVICKQMPCQFPKPRIEAVEGRPAFQAHLLHDLLIEVVE